MDQEKEKDPTVTLEWSDQHRDVVIKINMDDCKNLEFARSLLLLAADKIEANIKQQAAVRMGQMAAEQQQMASLANQVGNGKLLRP